MSAVNHILDDPCYAVTENELNLARFRCEAIISHIYHLCSANKLLLTHAASRDRIPARPCDVDPATVPLNNVILELVFKFKTYDPDAIATEWMELMGALRQHIPPFTPNVGVAIERANVEHDTRVSLKIITKYAPPTWTFPTTHSAVAALADWYIGQLDYPDVQTARKQLTSSDERQRISRVFLDSPDFDLRQFSANLSMEWRHSCAWLARQRSAVKPLDSKTTDIEPEFRTKPISKTKAAKLLGQNSGSSGVKWLNACIKDGTIRCEEYSRQRYVFDINDFPSDVHNQLRVTHRNSP